MEKIIYILGYILPAIIVPLIFLPRILGKEKTIYVIPTALILPILYLPVQTYGFAFISYLFLISAFSATVYEKKSVHLKALYLDIIGISVCSIIFSLFLDHFIRVLNTFTEAMILGLLIISGLIGIIIPLNPEVKELKSFINAFLEAINEFSKGVKLKYSREITLHAVITGLIFVSIGILFSIDFLKVTILGLITAIIMSFKDFKRKEIQKDILKLYSFDSISVFLGVFGTLSLLSSVILGSYYLLLFYPGILSLLIANDIKKRGLKKWHLWIGLSMIPFSFIIAEFPRGLEEYALTFSILIAGIFYYNYRIWKYALFDYDKVSD